MMFMWRRIISMGSVWIPDETILDYMQAHDGDRSAAVEAIQHVVEENRPEVNDD